MMDTPRRIYQKHLDAMLMLHEWGILVSFRNLDYRGLDFKKADLSEINFGKSLINRSQLEGCKLDKAMLEL